MGKWLKKGLEGIVILSLLTGCARVLSKTPIVKNTSNPTIVQLTETAVPTQIPADESWIVEHGFEQDVFEGYTEEQIQTYLNMDDEQVSALENLVSIKEDVFDEKLTPDSLLALNNHLSQIDAEYQLDVANYLIDMIGSRAYVLGLSDNLSPYFMAHAWDILEEDFGLDVITVFDNSKRDSKFYKNIESIVLEGGSYDNAIIGTIYHTVIDRVNLIKELAENDDVKLNELSAKELERYFKNNPIPKIAVDFNHEQVLQTIISAERDQEGPITFYLLPHMNLLDSKMIYNTFREKDTNYTPEEMFPKELFKALKGRHINFILSTCPVEFVTGTEKMIGLKEYLDDNNLSYTLLYGDNHNDPLRQLPIDGISRATDIILAGKYSSSDINKIPVVLLKDYDLVSKGEFEGEFVSVERNGNFNYYTISRFFENYNPYTNQRLDEFKEWSDYIIIPLIAQSSAEGLNPNNVDFELTMDSSDNIKPYLEYIPPFGIKLKK